MPEPKRAYEVVIVGGGGHGLATAYYLARNHGLTDVAVLERGWQLPGLSPERFDALTGGMAVVAEISSLLIFAFVRYSVGIARRAMSKNCVVLACARSPTRC